MYEHRLVTRMQGNSAQMLVGGSWDEMCVVQALFDGHMLIFTLHSAECASLVQENTEPLKSEAL